MIGEPLAGCTHRAFLGALHIVHAKPDAVVVSEIELGSVPLEMSRADVLVNAIDAALEDLEIVFAGVHGRAAAHIFADAVLKRRH